jgi:hypothetical protein
MSTYNSNYSFALNNIKCIHSQTGLASLWSMNPFAVFWGSWFHKVEDYVPQSSRDIYKINLGTVS